MGATDTYLRLALKAQGQCRATLETPTNIKKPRPMAFVKQANISHGPQQVNNGTSEPNDPRVRAREKNENAQNELLTDTRATHDNPMGTRTTGAASASNTFLDFFVKCLCAISSGCYGFRMMNRGEPISGSSDSNL